MTDMTPTHPTQASVGEVRHTPGPWVADDNEGFGAWSIWSRMPPTGHGKPGPKVASVHGDSAESDADALLIAAAPDLLAALRDLMDLESPVRIMPIGKEWDAARAAIARATSLPNEANHE